MPARGVKHSTNMPRGTLQTHPHALSLQIASCRVLWRTVAFFPHLTGRVRSQGGVMIILDGLRRFHGHRRCVVDIAAAPDVCLYFTTIRLGRYLYNAMNALRVLVPLSERLQEYVARSACATLAPLTWVSQSKLAHGGTGRPATRAHKAVHATARHRQPQQSTSWSPAAPPRSHAMVGRQPRHLGG